MGGMSKSGAAKTSMFFMGLPPVDNLEEITRYIKLPIFCVSFSYSTSMYEIVWIWKSTSILYNHVCMDSAGTSSHVFLSKLPY